MKRVLWAVLLILSFAPVTQAIERRNQNVKSQSGFVVYPILGRLPGVGTSYGGGLLLANFDGHSDVTLFAATGDLKAAGLILNDIPIIEDTLHVGVGLFDTTVPVRVYPRGMEADSQDYHVVVVRERGGSANLDLYFWKRRIHFFGRVGNDETSLLGVRDANGKGFRNRDSEVSPTLYSRAGARFDYTDDFRDPREGLRFEVARSELSVLNQAYSRAHAVSLNTTAYIPLFSYSTLALNYFRSKSYVDKYSPLSESDLRHSLSLHCTEILDSADRAVCQTAEDRRVRERAAANQQGNSASLGGGDRLRSFPTNRYRASETLFYGGELRWNLSDEKTPFDFLFMKGVRSNFQLAAFYEMGAVADGVEVPDRVTPVASYGGGVRMLFSGVVARVDFGWGKEGSEYTLFVNYPWGLPSL